MVASTATATGESVCKNCLANVKPLIVGGFLIFKKWFTIISDTWFP